MKSLRKLLPLLLVISLLLAACSSSADTPAEVEQPVGVETEEPSADEPDKRGRSSGVGRLLKFSELMVFIYNVKERKLSLDLNLIHPFSKIVVFNMGEVFSLLNEIDYGKIDRIRFDGDTIWIPAES